MQSSSYLQPARDGEVSLEDHEEEQHEEQDETVLDPDQQLPHLGCEFHRPFRLQNPCPNGLDQGEAGVNAGVRAARQSPEKYGARPLTGCEQSLNRRCWHSPC